MLKEIRKQSEPVRLVFMWLSVVITFAIIGYVWFTDFQDHLVAMIHPDLAPQESRLLAQISGPFSELKNSVKYLSATMGKAFGLFSGSEPNNSSPSINSRIKLDQPKPNFLPETR